MRSGLLPDPGRRAARRPHPLPAALPCSAVSAARDRGKTGAIREQEKNILLTCIFFSSHNSIFLKIHARFPGFPHLDDDAPKPRCVSGIAPARARKNGSAADSRGALLTLRVWRTHYPESEKTEHCSHGAANRPSPPEFVFAGVSRASVAMLLGRFDVKLTGPQRRRLRLRHDFEMGGD